MKRALAVLASVSCVFVTTLAAAASRQTAAPGQTPARDTRQPAAAAPAPSGTSSVSGVVVSADSNAKPLRQAHVVIVGAATGVLRVTETDAEGRFSFTNLPADRYTVGASKPPYLGAVAGANRPARPGAPVVVTAGQVISNLAIKLPPGAAVTGIVTDDKGQPARNVNVSLMQPRLQNGERVLTEVARAGLTDDRGRYRAFGLAPGDYVVVASPLGLQAGGGMAMLSDADVDAALKAPRPPVASGPAGVGPVPGSTPGARPGGAGGTGGGTPGAPGNPPAPVAYAPVFFPGTPRAADAVPVTIGLGEERGNVDIRLELVRTSRVEGVVTNTDGLPQGTTITVRAMSSTQSSSPTQVLGARVAPDGRFFLPSIPPGNYNLIAVTQGPQPNQFAAAAIEVAGNDQSGIQLPLQSPLRLSGRIAFDGGSAPPASIAGIRLPLRLVGANPGLSPIVSASNPAGQFTVTNVIPGRYIIGGPVYFGPTASSLTWALESVVADGRDITDLPIDISADAVPKDVVVTYSDRSQELSGRLLQSSGAAATGYTVVVFPADKAYWIGGSRRILTARPGADGHFAFGGSGPTSLPAGDYLIAAVNELDRDEQFDPSFLASLKAAAVPVKVAIGEKKTQNVVIR